MSVSSIISQVTAASELATYLLGANQDSVAVFDSGLNQVFGDARPISADVMPRARLLDHPLETGQMVTDYKVMQPIEISMAMIAQSDVYRDVYAEIWGYWQNSELLTVQTRTGSYYNMVIAEMPHEERVERYDAILLRMRFRQIMTNTIGNNFSPTDVNMSDTSSLGFLNPATYTITAQTLGIGSTAQAISAWVR